VKIGFCPRLVPARQARRAPGAWRRHSTSRTTPPEGTSASRGPSSGSSPPVNAIRTCPRGVSGPTLYG